MRSFFSSAVVLFLICASARADTLRITDPGDWAAWSLPGDAIEITKGGLRPTFVRRDINPVSNAAEFGGGIRAVGTDVRNAASLIDGDPLTTWSPDLEDPLADWAIEIDLGRVVSARRIQLFFAEDGEPLEFFKILTSDGEPFFSNANSVIPGTLRYNKSFRYSYNESRSIELDFGLEPLQYIRIQADQKKPSVRLSELVVESVGDNLSLGLKERGGSVSIVSEVGSRTRELVESTGISGTLIDGDINSYWGTVHRGGSGTQTEQQFGQFEIDLGALFWVDRVRMLGDGSGIAPGNGAGRHRGGVFNYLWYVMSGSDGSRAPDGSLRWEILGELPSNQRNLQGIVHFEERFALQKLRHLRLFFPMSDGFEAFNGRIGTTAEFQVFGEGHPAELIASSPLYDLGSPVNISSIEWSVDEPPDTRMEIRSRTGNLLAEEYTFYDKNGKEVTENRWNKLIPSFRGPIDTVRTPGADWSNWSRGYHTSGQLFLSPVPRRFVQLEVHFLSDDPFGAAALEEIALNFGNPLASETLGEIYPTQADPGQAVDFTYFLRTVLEAGSIGFDQVMLTSTAGVGFRGLRVDGEEMPVEVEEVEGGVRLTLAQSVRRSSLVEIDFRSTLFLNQTLFDAFLLDTAQNVRQQVDRGDASSEVVSEVNFISLPGDRRLIDGIAFSRTIFTPNGDGNGDRLRLEFNLLKLLVPRSVRVAIHDLSGRQVRMLGDGEATAGRVELEWDGRDGSGRLVAPGIYLVHIQVEGDVQTETVSRSVAVAY